MKKYIQFTKIYWRKLSAREQLIITVTLFVVIIMLWKSIFYQELDNNQIILQSELTRINNSISEVDKKIQLFKSDNEFDLDRENRRLLAVYAEESKRLDVTLKEFSSMQTNCYNYLLLSIPLYAGKIQFRKKMGLLYRRSDEQQAYFLNL